MRLCHKKQIAGNMLHRCCELQTLKTKILTNFDQKTFFKSKKE